MRREHWPFWARKLHDAYEAWHARHFLYPQFDAVGPGCNISKPWHVRPYGPNITLGSHVHVRATPSQWTWFTTWRTDEREGRIGIGDFCLIGPGTRVSASDSVAIGAASMLASNVYISDSDWHDTYDRTRELTKYAPVILEENVWVGDSAIVCKGVRIGRNSIIGAGSVVTGDIPANVIAAGNPAQVVRKLDSQKPMRTRRDLFADPDKLARETEGLYRLMLHGNSTLGWLRALLFPSRRD